MLSVVSQMEEAIIRRSFSSIRSFSLVCSYSVAISMNSSARTLMSSLIRMPLLESCSATLSACTAKKERSLYMDFSTSSETTRRLVWLENPYSTMIGMSSSRISVIIFVNVFILRFMFL
ncbi:hypothetical protein D3C72_1698420 [compost metagenome]